MMRRRKMMTSWTARSGSFSCSPSKFWSLAVHPTLPAFALTPPHSPPSFPLAQDHRDPQTSHSTPPKLQRSGQSPSLQHHQSRTTLALIGFPDKTSAFSSSIGSSSSLQYAARILGTESSSFSLRLSSRRSRALSTA